VRAPINFQTIGSILTKLFLDNVPRGRGDNMGTSFERPTP